MKEIKAFGHVNGESELSIYSRDLFMSGLSHFNQSNVEIIIRERFRPFSDQMREYYFAVIVREVQKAFRYVGVIKTLKDTDYYLRYLFLYTEEYDEETDQWSKTLHTLKKGESEVSMKMMKEYCDLCIIFSAQSLDWPIPFPNEELEHEEKMDRQKLEESPIRETTL